MEKIEQVGELVSVTFTWTIENFSRLKTQKHYSEAFDVGDFKWQIVVYPKGSSGNPGKHDLSIYLNVADASKLPSGWSRYSQFTLTVVNQLDSNHSITIETKHVFSESKSDWGFTSFMPLSELCDCSEGFIVNDTCVVEAEVAVSQVDYKIVEHRLPGISKLVEPPEHGDQRKGPSDVNTVQVPKSSIPLTAPSSAQMLAFLDAQDSEEIQTNAEFVHGPKSYIARKAHPSDHVFAFQDIPSSEQTSFTSSDSRSYSSIVKELEELTCTSVSELVDFRGLGRIEKAFVPLLEEVCLLHPALIECQRKRSPMFTEWAFTALGRLLYFLKTTKGKDMIGDACEHLQLLWEEVETFRFDLGWLEPHVQSALDMKKFVERAGQVKEMRQNVDTLETELKGLRARLAVAEEDRDSAKRDLGKAEKSFGGTNMDSELGYGRC